MLFRSHLACAIKSLEVGSQVIFGQGRKQRKEFDKLFLLIKDRTKLDQHMRSAISCLDEALMLCSDIPQSTRHRSKEVTKALLDKIAVLNETRIETKFLKVGDIVHCVVTSLNSSFVNVTLKTDDSRNYGSIHISKVSKKYIEDLSREVTISECFQAKIIKDFFDSDFGWGLTRLY